MRLKIIAAILLFVPTLIPPLASGQELYQDLQATWRARVLEVVTSQPTLLPGTDATINVQTVRAQLLDGPRQGEVLMITNDHLNLKVGDAFFLDYQKTINGDEIYSVRDVDRRGILALAGLSLVAVILLFGGWQGVRSLGSLAASLLLIRFILVPALLHGYPPVLVSVAVAAIILALAIYLTHGRNRESLAAFLGTFLAVSLTGILGAITVYLARFTGFASDEAVYLNLNTGGTLDFTGLLLGGIIIGALGVLDDIAITQAAVVRELAGSNPNLSRGEIYRRALRVGQEHIGALVNTLALAYTGASLSLILLFSQSTMPISRILNSELFATEIIRTVVGSIGLVATVPLTTLIAVKLLRDSTRTQKTNTPITPERFDTNQKQ